MQMSRDIMVTLKKNYAFIDFFYKRASQILLIDRKLCTSFSVCIVNPLTVVLHLDQDFFKLLGSDIFRAFSL